MPQKGSQVAKMDAKDVGRRTKATIDYETAVAEGKEIIAKIDSSRDRLMRLGAAGRRGREGLWRRTAEALREGDWNRRLYARAVPFGLSCLERGAGA
jgi:hypothetical protein